MTDTPTPTQADIDALWVDYCEASTPTDVSDGGIELYNIEGMDDSAYALYTALTAAMDEIERLRGALEACQDEIDAYIQQEYPFDHPVHERYRSRDFAANPARLALKGDTP